MPEEPISPRAVYQARPTVRIDSQDVPGVAELLLAMKMTETEGGMSALELRFSNWARGPQSAAALAFEDEGVLQLGARISVYAGDVNEPQEIFRGIVTGLEAEFTENPPELVVLAEDAFQAARFARRTRTYDSATLSDLAGNVASQINLTPVVTGLSGDIGVQVQLNESDLAFLRRLLSRFDADLQVVGDEMHVFPRSDANRGTVELAFRGLLKRVKVLADLSHQVTEVTVAGWDASQGQTISGPSQGANAGPGSGRTGKEVLQGSPFGDRSHHVGHLAATTQGEAQALADAAFDERARRFVVISGTAEGNPRVRVGAQVRVTGLSARFDNTYCVTRAVHRFDMAHGYLTDFEAECAYLGAP